MTTSSDVRVCFLGDSFVAGVGDPEHLGWAGRLAAGSSAAGLELTSYVLGVRGETSRQVLDRWSAECAPRLPAGVDGRIVVSFGVNDTTLGDRGPRVAAPDSLASLGALLDQAAGTPWAAFVVGPPPVDDDAHNRRTADLDEGFGQVCATAAVPYVSVLPALLRSPVWMAQVAAGDGAHPGASGYAELAGLVRPHWQRWLGVPGR
ncbi:GDSL-type esterase/lipase family protein [Modestobacter sp. SYSU DS0290]